MVELLPTKLILVTNSSNKKSKLTKSSNKMSTLMSLVSQKEKVPAEQSRDLVLSTCKRRPTEVGEELVVSVLGILLEYDSQFPESDN